MNHQNQSEGNHICACIHADVAESGQQTKTKILETYVDVLSQFCDDFLNPDNHICSSHTGDGLKFYTYDVVEAGRLALCLKHFFNSINWAKLGAENSLRLRIGVHVANLRVRTNGNGVQVNGKGAQLCSRIEEITSPGRIFVSKAFADMLCEKEHAEEHNFGFIDKGFIAFNKSVYKVPGCHIYDLVWEAELDYEKDVTSTEGLGDSNDNVSENKPYLKMQPADLALKIKDLICFNQGAVIQHFYLAADKHKAVKEAYKDLNAEDLDFNDKIEDLDEFLDSSIKTAIRENFRLANSILGLVKGQNNTPRYCFKYTFPDENGVQYIYTYDTDSDFENYREEMVHAVSENSMSRYVEKNGVAVIENNIPQQAKSGNYLNPRIDYVLLNSYEIPEDIKPFKPFVPKQTFDSEWINVWRKFKDDKGAQVPPRGESCYKSSLVVPATLANNALSPEFWDKILAKAQGTSLFGIVDDFKQAKKVKRHVFGFACLDYPEIEYFNSFDRDIGYMLADFISIYYLINLTFTTLSKNYREAYEIIYSQDGR